MDAKSFGNYLKEKLLTESKKYEGTLLSVSYENVGDAKRTSGIRDTLVGIANSIDSCIADFYDKGGHQLPNVSQTSTISEVK